MAEQQSPPPPSPPQTGESYSVPGGPTMDLSGYLSKAWSLVIGDPVLFIVGYLVIWLILALSIVTVVGPIILVGPLMFGYIRVTQNRLNDEPATFSDLFQGFNEFSKAFLTGLLLFLAGLGLMIPVGVIIVILRFIPCIGFPATFLLGIATPLFMATVLYFALSIAALSEAAPSEAISRSINFAMANFWPMISLVLATSVISTAGVLLCFVGTVLTTPIAITTGIIAYNEYYLPRVLKNI